MLTPLKRAVLRRSLSLLLCAIALTSILPASHLTAQAFAPSQSSSSSSYQIVSASGPGACVDVAGVSKANGAPTHIWSCLGSGQLNQLWTLLPVSGSPNYQVVSANSGACLDVTGVSTANGARIQQWGCGGSGALNQLWQLKAFGSSYELVSVNSGKCLDLAGGNHANGTILQQWDCGEGYNPNQLWNVQSLTASTQPPPPPATAGSTVPSSFFGMTVLDFANVNPSLQFATTRSWDSYFGVDWSIANPLPGIYNFTYLDNFIGINQARGAEIVYTFGRTPLWASSKPWAYSPYLPGECAPPADLRNWDNYVSAVVTHAAGRIKYWEIWNEPQDPQYYCGDIPTMVTMAQHAYSIIKSIDPSAKVVTPSVTSTGGPAWLNSYLRAGGGQYADIMSFHGYWSSTAEDINTVVKSYHDVLNANGQSNKPLWDTEASWAGSGSNVISDPSLRAAFLAKYYLLQWSNGVSRFIWYGYDSGGVWGGLWDRNAGLHADGVAYGEVSKWMIGASLTSPCSQSANGTWTCNLARPGGYQAQTVWNSTANITYQIPGQFVQYRDLTGRISNVSDRALTIGNQPILLETGRAF